MLLGILRDFVLYTEGNWFETCLLGLGFSFTALFCSAGRLNLGWMSRLKALEPGSVSPPLPLAWLTKTWAQGHLHSLVCPTVWTHYVSKSSFEWWTGMWFPLIERTVLHASWKKRKTELVWKTENCYTTCRCVLAVVHNIKIANRPNILDSCYFLVWLQIVLSDFFACVHRSASRWSTSDCLELHSIFLKHWLIQELNWLDTSDIACSLSRCFFWTSSYFATIKKSMFYINFCNLDVLHSSSCHCHVIYRPHCHSQILSRGFMGE